MGHSTVAARRCKGFQVVFTDEVADEKGGSAEVEPEGKRRPVWFDTVCATEGFLSRSEHVRIDFGLFGLAKHYRKSEKCFRIKRAVNVGA